MKSRFLIPIMVVAMALMPVAATSQGMPPPPETPVPGEAPVGIMAEFDIAELPTPHAEVWFLRMTLRAGGFIPLGEQAGPTILYIESGELVVEADHQITMQAGATPIESPAATTESDEFTTLTAGASAIIEAGTTARVLNSTAESGTFLVLQMFSALMENAGEEEMDQPVGLAQGGVSIGTAEFLPIPASITIERIVIDPGTTVEPEMQASEMEMPGYLGMELGTIETGSAEVSLENANLTNIMWPDMAETQMPELRMVPLAGSGQLETGDAYAFNGSTLTWTAAGDEPVTILRVVIMPQMPPME